MKRRGVSIECPEGDSILRRHECRSDTRGGVRYKMLAAFEDQNDCERRPDDRDAD